MSQVDAIKLAETLCEELKDPYQIAVVQILVTQIVMLRKHIDQMSCCCSGCTKHNAQLASNDGEKVGNEF
jgi:hypothetical protein